MNNIQKKVMDKISAGLIHQRPRWKFTLEKILSWGIVALAGLVTLYMTMFILLVSHEMAFFDMIGFGPRGVFMIMHMFPVLLIVGIAALLVVMVVMVRVYSHAYRLSGLALLLVIFGIGAAITVGVAEFDKNLSLARIGEHGEVPFMQSLHEHYRPAHQRPVAHGSVLVVQPGGFVLHERNDEILAIITDGSTQYSFSDAILEGDILSVLGVREGGMIHASVVMKEH